MFLKVCFLLVTVPQKGRTLAVQMQTNLGAQLLLRKTLQQADALSLRTAHTELR